MYWLVAVLVGAGTGYLVARLCRRFVSHALGQSLVASFAAMSISSTVMFGAIIALNSVGGRSTAYGFGFAPGGLVYGALYVMIFAALHWLAGWSARVAPHRVVLFGILGGLLGALPFAWLLELVEAA